MSLTLSPEVIENITKWKQTHAPYIGPSYAAHVFNQHQRSVANMLRKKHGLSFLSSLIVFVVATSWEEISDIHVKRGFCLSKATAEAPTSTECRCKNRKCTSEKTFLCWTKEPTQAIHTKQEVWHDVMSIIFSGEGSDSNQEMPILGNYLLPYLHTPYSDMFSFSVAPGTKKNTTGDILTLRVHKAPVNKRIIFHLGFPVTCAGDIAPFSETIEFIDNSSASLIYYAEPEASTYNLAARIFKITFELYISEIFHPQETVFSLFPIIQDSSLSSRIYSYSAFLLRLTNFRNSTFITRQNTEKVLSCIISHYGGKIIDTLSKDKHIDKFREAGFSLEDYDNYTDRSFLAVLPENKVHRCVECIEMIKQIITKDTSYLAFSIDSNKVISHDTLFSMFDNEKLPNFKLVEPDRLECSYDALPLITGLSFSEQRFSSGPLIPIFLKPSAFLSQSVFSLLLKDLPGEIEMPFSFMWSDQFISQLYPHCMKRSYGLEWTTYLQSRISSIGFFIRLHAGKTLDDLRNAMVTARKDSMIIWTRNIVHCPSSWPEVVKNHLDLMAVQPTWTSSLFRAIHANLKQIKTETCKEALLKELPKDIFLNLNNELYTYADCLDAEW